MPFEITKNSPLPPRALRAGEYRDTLNKMSVATDYVTVHKKTQISNFCIAAKRLNMRTASRAVKTVDADGLIETSWNIWRVE